MAMVCASTILPLVAGSTAETLEICDADDHGFAGPGTGARPRHNIAHPLAWAVVFPQRVFNAIGAFILVCPWKRRPSAPRPGRC
eukprot:8730313-Lingulodinium_polyedra.AAC.1